MLLAWPSRNRSKSHCETWKNIEHSHCSMTWLHPHYFYSVKKNYVYQHSAKDFIVIIGWFTDQGLIVPPKIRAHNMLKSPSSDSILMLSNIVRPVQVNQLQTHISFIIIFFMTGWRTRVCLSLPELPFQINDGFEYYYMIFLFFFSSSMNSITLPLALPYTSVFISSPPSSSLLYEHF